ncbi:MAG: aldose 1-epimerase family protein [Phycisphaerae bacterium]|nr:aldose 1-epimerase family protein [Phycisphaerae bacterium]
MPPTDPFRQTLTSTKLNLNLEDFDLDGRAVTPACPVPWSLRKRRLRGGRQEGVDTVEIDNGHLSVRVIPTRGLGIAEVICGDVRLGWKSPVQEIVHPAFIDPNRRGGIGWLDGFNEWLVRCGLEWFGAPCEDPHHHAAAEAPASPLTLHGRIANLPASQLSVEVETRAPYRIHLRGLVREQSLFAPNLDLESVLTLEPGAAGFRIQDTITNRSSQAQEFGLLYHINQGAPMLEQGARLIAPVKHVAPATDRAAEGGMRGYDRFAAPQRGYAEQVYLMRLHADRRGMTQVMLQNSASDRGLSLAWPIKPLPAFTLWKNTADEADGYVTGLEPGTNYPLPRPVERAAGRVPKLRKGQSHSSSIEVGVQTSKSDVNATAKRIRGIAGGRKTIVGKVPGEIV